MMPTKNPSPVTMIPPCFRNMPESWNMSDTGTWGSDAPQPVGPSRAKKVVTHVTTAVMGLTATALMTGALHYGNTMEETPHLVVGIKVAEAAVGWSAVSTALIPGIQAAAKWPTKGATIAMAATGSLTTVGVALTAVATSVEALHASDNTFALMRKHVSEYGTSAELTQEIDTIQIEYACCGADGPSTYEENREHITGEVPDSCCTSHDQPCDHLYNEHIKRDGCAEPLGEEVETLLRLLTALLIAHTWALAVTTAAAAATGLRGCGPCP